MNTPEVDHVVSWYRNLSDETKNFWAFRWLRMQDSEYETIYGVMKAAEKLSKAVKRSAKEKHGP